MYMERYILSSRPKYGHEPWAEQPKGVKYFCEDEENFRDKTSILDSHHKCVYILNFNIVIIAK